MGKFYATGKNTNGVLGLGDTINKYFFTEGDLGELQCVKMCNQIFASSNVVNIALMSDGYLYYCGGPETVSKDVFTKFFDADKLIDMAVTAPGDAATGVGIIGITASSIYKITLIYDETTLSMTSSYTLVDDSEYQWSALYPKRLVECLRWVTGGDPFEYTKVYIATDSRVYIMDAVTTALDEYLFPEGTTITKMSVGVTGGGGSIYAVFIDNEGTLWGHGNNSYGQILPGGDTNIDYTHKMAENVISADCDGGRTIYVDSSGGVHFWGYYANYYDIRGTGSSTDTITDTDAFVYGFKKAWLNFNRSLNRNFTVFLQKSDGTIWASGLNTNGQAGVGTSDNISGLMQTSTTVYKNVEIVFLGVLASVIYEGELSIRCYVYTPDGSRLMITFNNLPGVKKLYVGGILPASFILTDYNNIKHTASIQYTTPREFLGLAYNPNSSSPIFVAGDEYDINFNVDTDLYLVLGEAVIEQGMEIRAYKYFGEPNRVRKDELLDTEGNYRYLDGYVTFSGTLREECSLMKPVVLFEMSRVPQFNYVYIPEFLRWYYVGEIESVNQNLWRMYLDCDVLCSFQDDIYALQDVIISRSEYSAIQNGQLEDPYIRTYSNVEKEIYEDTETQQWFGVGLGEDSHCFVLDTIGVEVPKTD